MIINFVLKDVNFGDQYIHVNGYGQIDDCQVKTIKATFYSVKLDNRLFKSLFYLSLNNDVLTVSSLKSSHAISFNCYSACLKQSLRKNKELTFDCSLSVNEVDSLLDFLKHYSHREE